MRVRDRNSALIRAVCLLAVAAWVAWHTFFLFDRIWAGPFRDYWVDLDVVFPWLDGHFSGSDFLALHNDTHRLALPRLLYYLDYRWADGTNHLIAAVGLLCLAGMAGLFGRAVWHAAPQGRTSRLTPVLGLCLVLLTFNSTMLFNVFYASNIQWPLAALLGLGFTGCAFQSRGGRGWIPAVMLLLAGLFSNLLALFYLVGFGLDALLRRRWRAAGITVAIGFAILILYWPGGEGRGTALGSLLSLLAHPVIHVSHWLDLLGLGHREWPSAARHLTGSVSLLVCAMALWPHYRSGRAPHASERFLAVAVWAGLLFLLAVAVQRGYWFPGNMFSERFQLMVWLTLTPAWLLMLISVRPVWFKAGITGLLLAGSLHQAWGVTHTIERLAQETRLAQARLMAGPANKHRGATLLTFVPDDPLDHIALYHDFFASRGLGYAQPFEQLQKRAQTLNLVQCPPPPEHYRVQHRRGGTLVRPLDIPPGDTWLAVDARGTALGYGASLRSGQKAAVLLYPPQARPLSSAYLVGPHHCFRIEGHRSP